MKKDFISISKKNLANAIDEVYNNGSPCEEQCNMLANNIWEKLETDSMLKNNKQSKELLSNDLLCKKFQKVAVTTSLCLIEDWINSCNDHHDVELIGWKLSECKKMINEYKPKEFDKDLIQQMKSLKRQYKDLTKSNDKEMELN